MECRFRAKVAQINKELSGWQFDLSREKDTQQQLMEILSKKFFIKREHRLSNRDICDFWIDDEIAVEVKVKGAKTAIFRQLQRYCSHESVKCLLFITAKSMGLPPQIEGKPVYYISLSKGML